MTVKEIIKKTLQKMSEDGALMTPTVYKNYFCKEVKNLGLIVDDCQELEKYTSKMNETLQKQFKKYYPKNLDDLIVFMSSNLNRAHLGDAEYLNNALYSFLNTAFDTMVMLGDKKLKDISLDTKSKLKTFYDQKSIEFFRDKFVEYNKNFTTPIDERWSKHIVRYGDLGDFSTKAFDVYEEVFEELEVYKKDISLIAKPSVSKNSEPKRALEQFLLEKREPIDIQSALQESLSKRVENDKEEIEKHTGTLNEIIDVLSMKLVAIVDKNQSTKNSIALIKDALSKALDLRSVEDIKEKMSSIADELESEIGQLNSSLNEKNREIGELRVRVRELESSLQEAETISKMDHLTKVMTRRGFEEELHRFESLYDRHSIGFAILFLDIDFFKKINDTYGHDAGDKVLASMGGLLLKNSREEDILGRYGGEEFIAVLPGATMEGAKTFAEHIRGQVESSRFMYKNKRIPVTISIGVALREESSSVEDTLKRADEKLYVAKKNGRNRVEY